MSSQTKNAYLCQIRLLWQCPHPISGWGTDGTHLLFRWFYRQPVATLSDESFVSVRSENTSWSVLLDSLRFSTGISNSPFITLSPQSFMLSHIGDFFSPSIFAADFQSWLLSHTFLTWVVQTSPCLTKSRNTIQSFLQHPSVRFLFSFWSCSSPEE